MKQVGDEHDDDPNNHSRSRKKRSRSCASNREKNIRPILLHSRTITMTKSWMLNKICQIKDEKAPEVDYEKLQR